MDNMTMLVTVLEVASLTEDRDEQEQRALLDLALSLDKERGAFTMTNRDLAPPTLVAHVEATYEPSTGRMISLTAAQRAQYDRLCEQWAACGECGWPVGTHAAGDALGSSRCPRDDDYFVRSHHDALLAWRAARQLV